MKIFLVFRMINIRPVLRYIIIRNSILSESVVHKANYLKYPAIRNFAAQDSFVCSGFVFEKQIQGLRIDVSLFT